MTSVPGSSRSTYSAWIALVAVVAGAVAAGSASPVSAAPAPVAVYDSINSPMPPNVPSLGFQATQTASFGDLVQLSPGARRLTSFTVMMSSWGCETGGGATCTTSSGATFDHPLTLTLYQSAPGTATGIGAQVLTQTTTFSIPFRPSADPTCAGGTAWRASNNNCYNGFATPVTFEFPTLPTIPTNLVWTISYNTSNYGSAPIGAPCTSNCAYDSLNVGLSTLPSTLAGVDLDPTSAVANSADGGVNCGLGSGLKVAAGCWSAYRPMARISTLAASETETTQVVRAADTSWVFFPEGTTGGQAGSYVTGPSTPPLGVGSAQLAVTATNEGMALGKAFLAGTALDRLTQLAYSSNQPSGVVAPSLQFNVSYDGNPTFQGRLVYEPTYSVGTVPAGWQRWNTLTGKWWATGGVGDDPGNCPQATPCTWSQILAKFPNAMINPNSSLGAVLLKVGSGVAAFTGNVDDLTIGIDDGTGALSTTNYDFEPTTIPPPGIPDFNPVTPTRVFDTRVGTPPALRDVPTGRIGPTDPLVVQLTDLPGGLVPATGVGAVSINVTATGSLGPGFVTVAPCGSDADESSVNFETATDRANAVITKVSPAGTVCFWSSTPTYLVVDVNGWFKTPPGYNPIEPARLLDTRAGAPPALLTVPRTRLVPGTVLEVPVTNLPGLVPATGVGAVTLNVTSTRSLSDGFLTVWPCGPLPNASNLNFQQNRDGANLVIAPVSATGTICFAADNPTDLVVDIDGWFKKPSGYTAVGPARVADTRTGNAGLRTVPTQKVVPGSVLTVQLTDLPGGFVPASGVGAVSINVTSTRQLANGFLTVVPCGAGTATSSVNFQAGLDRANAVITPVSATGTICITTSEPTDVVIDVNGWFSNAPTP